MSADERMRERSVARAPERRAASPATRAAVSTYSSAVAATQSCRPSVVSRLAALRDTERAPASVITGTPIQSASHVVAPPP